MSHVRTEIRTMRTAGRPQLRRATSTCTCPRAIPKDGPSGRHHAGNGARPAWLVPVRSDVAMTEKPVAR